MSFDEGNLLRDQSSHVDTVTNTSEANDQGHTEPGCSNKKPAGTSLIYQALFLHGETTQSQGELLLLHTMIKVIKRSQLKEG